MRLEQLPKKSLVQIQERRRVWDVLVRLGLTRKGAERCLREIFPDEWYSVPAMAKRLGISSQGVWYRVRRGKLKACQFQGLALVARQNKEDGHRQAARRK